MKRLALLLGLVASSLPVAARAQVGVSVNIGLPVSPPLVVVQPGVQIVENYDEEVFFTNGWYWCRRPNGWFRARSPRASFVFVQPRYVPASIVRIPPGQYRHWRREDHPEWAGHHRGWNAHERAEHRGWKEHERAEHREWKEARKEEKRERHHEREHEREHGHGHH
jgi:hypothetical protein